ncbi:MAG: YdcF family protein [Myxococcota bacterium]
MIGLLGYGRVIGRAAGAFLVRDDALVASDAIVILGGDATHRAPHGAALYAQGLAPTVLAVGGTDPNGHSTQARKTERALVRLGVPPEAILVAGQYEPSTLEEARATADYAVDRGWRRIIVVTSPYHTWRAGMMFHDILDPLSVEVLRSAAADDPFDPARWWAEPRQRRQVRNEYLKTLWWRVAGR